MTRRLLPALLVVLAGCPPKHEYPDGSGLTGQLEREVIALQQRIRALEYELEHCADDSGPDSVYRDLHQVFRGSEVDISRQGSTTVLTLPSDYLFSGGTDLREEATMSLDLVATALKLHPEHMVTVEGHTDDRMPSGDLRRLYADNWVLSYARAEAVMHALVTEFKVDPSRFTIEAHGEYNPVATNDTAPGQAKNRRVVIVIVPPNKPVLPEQE